MSQLADWFSQGIFLITQGNSYLQAGLYITISFLLVLLVNRMTEKYKILGERNWLSALSCVLFLGLFNTNIYLSPALFAGFFLMLALNRLFKTYNQENFGHIFDVGFFIGVASLLYPPAIFTIIAMGWGLTITRIFDWREWVTCLMGLFTAIFLMWTYCFVVSGDWNCLFSTWDLMPQFNYRAFLDHPEELFKYLALIPLMGVSMVFLQQKLLKIELQSRKFLVVLMWTSIVGFLISLVFSSNFFQGITLCLLPMSILLAFFFKNNPNKWAAEAPHILLILMIFIVQYVFS